MASSPIDLTTLAAVKRWGKITDINTGDDVLLQGAITGISRAILSHTNRPTFYGRTVPVNLEGMGGNRLMLPDYPITSITSISAAGSVIPIGTAPSPSLPQMTSGALLDPWDGMPPGTAQAITLYGYGFPRGFGMVQAVYRTGFETISDPATIPLTSAYTILPAPPSGGIPMVDSGVTAVSTGLPMTRVSASPASGQYTFTPSVGYTFNAAQAGVAVLLSYSWAPADVFHVATEWVLERYKYRDRMSESTRSVNGQLTASYDISAMNKFTQSVLNSYIAVGPLF